MNFVFVLFLVMFILGTMILAYVAMLMNWIPLPLGLFAIFTGLLAMSAVWGYQRANH